MSPSDHIYDVLCLGSGFGGLIASIVLRRLGLAVALIERTDHPRYALGETVTPDTEHCLAELGRKYAVPELIHLSSYTKLRRRRYPISTFPKRAFIWFKHEPFTLPRQVRDIHFLVDPVNPAPNGPSTNFYRADLDHFLLGVARSYGVVYHPYTSVKEVSARPAALEVGCVDKSGHAIAFRGRLVLDAAGATSPLARAFGLRVDDPPRICIRTGTVYSLFSGVHRVADVMPTDDAHEMPGGEYVRIATPNHLFDAGRWMWQIPFDNGLTSLGIVASQDEIASYQDDPERPFLDCKQRYPLIARLLEHAEPTMPLRVMPRIQYGARQMVGDRFILLPSSCSSIDPLLSTGMALTMLTITRIAYRIGDRFREIGPLSRQALVSIEQDYFLEEEYVSKLLACLYASWGAPRCFDTIYRLAIAAFFTGGLRRAQNVAANLCEPLWGIGTQEIRTLIDSAYEFVTQPGRTPLTEADRAPLEAHVLARSKSTLLDVTWNSRRSPMAFTHLDGVRMLRRLGQMPGYSVPRMVAGLARRYALSLMETF